MKTTIFRSSWQLMVAGAAMAPAVLLAQSSPADTTSRTIFFGSQPAGGLTMPDEANRAAVQDSAVPAQVYEAMSAPFVTDSFAFARAGRCLGTTDESDSGVRGVLVNRSISLLAPASGGATEDSRWMLVRRGPFIPGFGVVGIPTGIVRLTSASTAMTPVHADVVAQFDAISCADAVFPMPYLPPPPRAKPTAVNDGVRGRVVWVEGGRLLPSLQHAMVVNIGTEAGVRAGDRVTIHTGDGTVAAKANVVRADRRTSTVRLVSVTSATLTSGLEVRVAEKLP